MKLKAILEDPKVFCDIFDLCRSTQQTCTVCLQAGTTRVFSSAEVTDTVQVWAECRTNTVLREFRCQSPYNDSLVCDILDTRHLCHVLKSAEKLKGAGYEREMRLSKNAAGPLLKLSFRSQKGLKHERYDVPIRLRSQQEIESLQVPALDEVDSVQVVVPHLAELSSFVDSLRSARCEEIVFRAKVLPAERTRKAARGHPGLFASLHIEAAQDYAHLRLQYRRVPRTPPSVEEALDDDDVAREPREEATVTVPLRRFAPFIASVRSLDPSLVSLHLVHERALVFCFSHAHCANVAAYIPAVIQQTFH